MEVDGFTARGHSKNDDLRANAEKLLDDSRDHKALAW